MHCLAWNVHRIILVGCSLGFSESETRPTLLSRISPGRGCVGGYKWRQADLSDPYLPDRPFHSCIPHIKRQGVFNVVDVLFCSVFDGSNSHVQAFDNDLTWYSSASLGSSPTSHPGNLRHNVMSWSISIACGRVCWRYYAGNSIPVPQIQMSAMK